MRKNVYNSYSGIYLNYGYLMFPISLNIVSKIIIGTKIFFSKNGYHVSLLRLEDLSETDQKKVLEFAQQYTVKIKKITNIYRLVIQENQQSIIVRVQIQGLKKLIKAVNKQFGYHFVYPPAHITLFTLKDQFGIALNSSGEYRRLTSQLSKSDSQRITKSFKPLMKMFRSLLWLRGSPRKLSIAIRLRQSNIISKRIWRKIDLPGI
jgi:hypothetical protein